MEKQVYIPTEEELYQMQDMGVNIYKYLLVKAAETIMMEGIKYSNKGMLKNSFNTIKEYPELAYIICSLYPEELKYSKIANQEVGVALDILDKEEDRSIYKLDNLVYFDDSISTNCLVAEKTISILEEKLPITPQYRFEYKDFECIGYDKKGFPILNYNKLLNDIFSCKYSLDYFDKESIIKSLIKIEPAYALKFYDKLGTDAVGLLRAAINDYAERYQVSHDAGYQYYNKDILSNPDDNVKRLKRAIRKIY